MENVNEDFPIARFVRLKNGDDIIAEVVDLQEDDNCYYILINPLKVVYMNHPNDTRFIKVSFVPWVFDRICEHQEFTISCDDVLITSNVCEKMNKYYWTSVDPQESEERHEVEETVSETPDELQDILEALKQARRTYH